MEPFMLNGRHRDGPMHRVEKPRGITRDYISGIRLRSLASETRTYATVPVLKGPDVTRHKGGKAMQPVRKPPTGNTGKAIRLKITVAGQHTRKRKIPHGHAGRILR